MHAITGHKSVGKMRSVLTHSVVRRQHDVAEHGQFSVDEDRTIDGGDHRDLNVQEIHEELFRVPVNMIPYFWSNLRGGQSLSLVAGVNFFNKCTACTGEDDDSVLGVAADITKSKAKFLMWTCAPTKGLAIAVQRQLQNAFTTLHTDMLIFRSVVGEGDHSLFSCCVLFRAAES